MGYPYIFKHENQIYMLPDYRDHLTIFIAVGFPFHWRKHVVVTHYEVVNPSLVYFNRTWWMFSVYAQEYGGHYLWTMHAKSPLGPWYG